MVGAATPGWRGIELNLVPDDVEQALADLGVEVLRTAGDEAVARCPMHLARMGKTDRHPSFSVNTASGLFSCLSCGYAGVFTRLVADVLDIDSEAATAWIRGRSGMARVMRALSQQAEPAAGQAEKEPPVTEADLALFCDPPDYALEERAIDLSAAREYGVLWDPAHGTWILPIRDPATGALMGWQAKRGSWVRNHPKGVRKALTLFGLHAYTGGPLRPVESPLDCPRILSAGVRGAVATYGAMVSSAQADLMVETADEIVLGLDDDVDGRKQQEILAGRLRGRCDRLTFLDYSVADVKDPGDMSDGEIRAAYAGARSRIALLLEARR
jgi:hypothetical protein